MSLFEIILPINELGDRNYAFDGSFELFIYFMNSTVLLQTR